MKTRNAEKVFDIFLNEKSAILLGRGAAHCAGDNKLIKIAEKLQIPVATTPKGKGIFPEDHKLALGCLSSRGSRAAGDYILSGLDVLLVIGTDLGEFTTFNWNSKLLPAKALIQIDIDPNEIGKNYPVTIGIAADAGSAISSLYERVKDISIPKKSDISALKNSLQYFSEPAAISDAVPIKPQRLMAELRKYIPRDAIILADMGNTMSWFIRFFQSYPEGVNILPTGLACMGASVASAIGAKLAAPDQKVICFSGDGDFLMTGLEILSAVDYSIPVIWIILKNNRLGSIYDIENLCFKGRHSATIFKEINFLKIANAFNMQAFKIESPNQIQDTFVKVLDSDKPTIIEVIIDPDEKFNMG